MMQRLRICSDRFGNRWQRLAFELGKHAHQQIFEVFKAADIRKQVLVELTILIDKGNSWNGLSCLAHDSSLPLAHTLSSSPYYTQFDRRGLYCFRKKMICYFRWPRPTRDSW